MKIKILILLMITGLSASAQWKNVNPYGKQINVVGGDTLVRDVTNTSGQFIYSPTIRTINKRAIYLSQYGSISDAGNLRTEYNLGASVPGTDNTLNIQKALTDTHNKGGGTVYIDGQFKTGSLIIYSNTTLIALPNCGLILKSGTNTDLIRNANFNITGARIDSNIIIHGGVFNGNAKNQSIPTGTFESYKGIIRLAGVKNIEIRDAFFYYPLSFTNTFVNSRNINIINNLIDVGTTTYTDNKDGWHFNGPIEHIRLINNRVKTGDDSFAINADDAYTDTSIGGPITDVIADGNVFLDGCAQGFRLLSGQSLIDDIHILNTSGKTYNFWLISDNLKGINSQLIKPGSGNFGKIDVNGSAVENPMVNKSRGYHSSINFQGQYKEISLRNISRYNFGQDTTAISNGSGFTQDIGLLEIDNTTEYGATNIDNLIIDNIKVNLGTKKWQYPLIKIRDINIKSAMISSISIDNSGGSLPEGLHISANSQNLNINNISVKNSVLQAVVLSGSASSSGAIIDNIIMDEAPADLKQSSVSYSPFVSLPKTFISNNTGKTIPYSLKSNLSNPYAQYDFKQGTGTTRIDSTINALNLTDTYSNVSLSTGRGTGGAISLSTSTPQQLINNSFVFADSTSVYFEFKYTGTNTVGFIGNSTSDSNIGWTFLIVYENGAPYLYLQTSNNGSFNPSTQYNLGPISSGWNKVGFSYRTGDRWSVWLNGYNYNRTGLATSINPTGKLIIGYRPNYGWSGSSTFIFGGLRVFNNYMFTETDVETLASGQEPYYAKGQQGSAPIFKSNGRFIIDAAVNNNEAVSLSQLSGYQTVSNLSTDLTASPTKYPSVNAVNTGLSIKENILTAINGVSKSGNNIGLGGDGSWLYSNYAVIAGGANKGYLELNPGSAFLGYSNSSNLKTGFYANPSGNSLEAWDDVSKKGLSYKAKYRSGLNNRWIPDKEYVDSLTLNYSASKANLNGGNTFSGVQILINGSVQPLSGFTDSGFINTLQSNQLTTNVTTFLPTNGGVLATLNDLSQTVSVSGTSQPLSSNRVYIPHSASLTTFTLPTTATEGQLFQIVGEGAGGWRISQNASQQIVGVNVATTSGTTGYVQSTNANCTITIRCTVANSKFTITSSQGTLTIN